MTSAGEKEDDSSSTVKDNLRSSIPTVTPSINKTPTRETSVLEVPFVNDVLNGLHARRRKNLGGE